MPEEILNGANIVAVLEQVSGEGVAESMGGDMFEDAGELRRLLDGVLEARRA